MPDLQAGILTQLSIRTWEPQSEGCVEWAHEHRSTGHITYCNIQGQLASENVEQPFKGTAKVPVWCQHFERMGNHPSACIICGENIMCAWSPVGRIHGPGKQGVQAEVTPLTIAPKDPERGSVLPASAPLSFVELEVLISKEDVILPGDTTGILLNYKHWLLPAYFGLLCPGSSLREELPYWQKELTLISRRW